MKKIALLLLFIALSLADRTPIIHRNRAPNGWHVGKKAHPRTEIEFSILLKQNNLDKLDDAFHRISNPKNADWGKFMTVEEINALVKADAAAFDAVNEWLEPFSALSQIKIYSDYIKVKTPVAVASKLFNVNFHRYHNPQTGKSFVRALGTATIPQHLSAHIDFVVGLSEFFVQNIDKQLNANSAYFRLKAAPAQKTGKINQDLIVTPALLKQYYQVPQDLKTTNPNNLQGIAAFTDYFSMGALTSFTQNQNLTTPNVTRIGPDCMPDCDQYESDLDIQYITAMAQNTPTIFLNQPSNYWILQFAQDTLEMSPAPKVFSISYGWSELAQCDIAVYVCATLGYNSQQYVNRTNQELKKLGAAGVTVLVSDGDDGAPSLGGATGNCPIDLQHWCPLGGCSSTSSQCGSFYVLNVTTGESCIFPMGLGNDACNAILQDSNFDAALTKFVTYNYQCNLNFETDVEQMPHVYSSCTCDRLRSVSLNNYVITSYTYNSSIAVFTPDYPTSSPYVTSVGATQFLSNGNNDITEVGCSILTGAIITTGGGFSSFQPMPDYQQSAVHNYISQYSSALPPSNTYNPNNRAYPDIAFNGHHYKIFYSNDSTDNCPCLSTEVDGTSCSSPALSGLLTLINDQLLNKGKSQLGFLNYLLYQMASEQPNTLNDITSGNNKCNRAYCCQYGYTATKGWDAVSGLGSPNFPNMLQYILNKKGVQL